MVKRVSSVLMALALVVAFSSFVIAADTAAKAAPAFVGSAKSKGKAYHVPDCMLAKKIKAENLVTFADAAEAEAKGYTACKKCVKTAAPTKGEQH